MKTFSPPVSAACLMLALLAACSPRIYRPPALGAEYRFNEKMDPPKHPQALFDKKMTQDLQKQGILGQNAAKPAAVSGQKPDSAQATAPAKNGTITNPASASSPASPDSSRNGQD